MRSASTRACQRWRVPGGCSGEPLLPGVDQRGGVRRRQVEGGPVVLRQRPGRARRAARRATGNAFSASARRKRLVVGQRAAGGQVAEGAVGLRRVVSVAEHARQLQADLHLQVDGDRGGVLADVVRVVRQGQHLRRQPGQQQVRGHVPDVARAVERYGLLQRGGQLVQFAAHARLERQVVRVLRGGRGDRRRILRMEVAPPVHVVAQELHHQLLEQGVVFAVRTQETGVQRVVTLQHRWQGGGHASHPCSQPSGWCIRAMPSMAT